MKNSECEIHILCRREPCNCIQVYLKRKKFWRQITGNAVHDITAEQLLSHLLPLLEEGYKGPYKIVVRRA